MTILVGFVPSLMARKGIAGRTKVANAFKAYFEAGGHKRGSLLVQNRYDTSSKYGVSVEDIARYEVGGSIAILVNTAPAVFWTLLYIYSHPAVLEAVRKEVGLIVTSEPKNSSSGKTWSLDISNVKTDCPLLASTYQEVLRHRSMGTSVRQVMEDTVLDGKWLLKKDCMIQMPSRVIHKDPSLWGNDVDDFVPRRFVKDETQKTSTGKRPPATAFRAFGGGSTLCPGRHFATNEILAVVTMFVMRYEMAPVSGSWEYPSTDNTNVAAVVMEPDSDVEVRIEPREGYEDGHWEFSLKDSDKIFAIVAEDKE